MRFRATALVVALLVVAMSPVGPPTVAQPEPADPPADPDDGDQQPEFEMPAAFAPRLNQGGGSAPGNESVSYGLEWLADHQNGAGMWRLGDYYRDSRRPRGRLTGVHSGNNAYNIGGTGLAVLAFLGAGHTPRHGSYREVVSKAVKWLMEQQDDDGCFDSDRETTRRFYNHVLAVMALAEAGAMTGDREMLAAAQRGVNYIAEEQKPGSGWGYMSQSVEFVSSHLAGWTMLALHSARLAGLSVPGKCLDGAFKRLDELTGVSDDLPKTGYIERASGNARLPSTQDYRTNNALDGVNIAIRCLMARNAAERAHESIEKQAKRMLRPGRLPRSGIGDSDYCYWFWGTLALHQLTGGSGEQWEKFHGAVLKALNGNAHNWSNARDLKMCGLFSTSSAWGSVGGPVYTTAMACLILETPYRLPVVGTDPPQADPGDGDGDADPEPANDGPAPTIEGRVRPLRVTRRTAILVDTRDNNRRLLRLGTERNTLRSGDRFECAGHTFKVLELDPGKRSVVVEGGDGVQQTLR